VVVLLPLLRRGGGHVVSIAFCCLDKMENSLPALCVFIDIQKGEARKRVVVFSSSAPFSREQQQMRLPRFSLNLSKSLLLCRNKRVLLSKRT